MTAIDNIETMLREAEREDIRKLEMTLKYKLTKMFKKKQLIPICMLCDKHRIEDVWIKHKRNPDYREYSHTYCNDCFKYVLECKGFEDRRRR